MTNRDKILHFMRSIAPNGATNEEIVAKTGVRPHQTVFQITRKLKDEGLLKAVHAGKEWRFWHAGMNDGVLATKLTESPSTNLPKGASGIRDESAKDHPPLTYRDPESMVIEERAGKPSLTTDGLLEGGFTLAARWHSASDGRPQLDAKLPNEVGVYAFTSAGSALYVGVATMGLRKRIYFYGNPGRTQRTSQRIHDLIKQALLAGQGIEVYIALPPDSAWNGLPIHGSAGLELGLISKYSLPWNKRSAG